MRAYALSRGENKGLGGDPQDRDGEPRVGLRGHGDELCEFEGVDGRARTACLFHLGDVRFMVMMRSLAKRQLSVRMGEYPTVLVSG